MIKPALQDEAFLADVHAPLSSTDEFRLWWLGQSGYLLKWRDLHVLVDPYLSDSLTAKYAATDRPHVRMSERVVDPSRLDFINVVTSSHNHTDHLDGDTLRPLLAMNRHLKLVVPLANREFVSARVGVKVEHLVGVSHKRKAVIGPIEVHGVSAAHEQLERDERGRDLYLGYVLKFGPHAVYHSGDTVMHPSLVSQITFHFPVDVALLPINGRAPEHRVAGNLDGREAAWLAKTVGAKLVIPCHYDMFEFNTATPDEFIAECQRLNQPYRVLQLGERWSSSQLPTP